MRSVGAMVTDLARNLFARRLEFLGRPGAEREDDLAPARRPDAFCIGDGPARHVADELGRVPSWAEGGFQPIVVRECSKLCDEARVLVCEPPNRGEKGGVVQFVIATGIELAPNGWGRGGKNTFCREMRASRGAGAIRRRRGSRPCRWRARRIRPPGGV